MPQEQRSATREWFCYLRKRRFSDYSDTLLEGARTNAELKKSAKVSWGVRTHREGLPGSDLVQEGLDDLSSGVQSVAALLVSIGEPRLRRLGFQVPNPISSPEHRLYERLRAEDSDAAHSRYNALIRRLVSFERAAACAT